MKEVRLVNIADCGVGLRDTQDRFYNVPVKGQLRINTELLMGILDEPISKKMICEGLVKIEGLEEEMLRGVILTDEEYDYLLGDRIAPATESLAVETVVAEEEEEIEEETKELKPIVFYTWIKNDNEEKLREAMKDAANVKTLNNIVSKNDKYKTPLVEKILKEAKNK